MKTWAKKGMKIEKMKPECKKDLPLSRRIGWGRAGSGGILTDILA
ncbi:hypothetical protein T231_17200 [Tannerella sp. oral taxon BU063 isolate Cell 6/7/9]|uniref:Uncharacterized protein n=1 Tax=Tannerella sp. oral taxon BU063 isolate Cell 6/7/9 TaxID=1411021 RepID=W2CLR3_9BACT|nr:hypothetical protein T231_17200 [Tannerella sp. oral taxon BU063 isolate Cell 6/7/9]